VLIPGKDAVVGEVYLIDPEHFPEALMELDNIEGEGYMYTRDRIMVRPKDSPPGDKGQEAWAYVGHPEYWAAGRQRYEIKPNELGLLEFR